MSTANFRRVNANNFYRVETSLYYDEELECWVNEYIDGSETQANEFILDDIRGMILYFDDTWNSVNEYSGDDGIVISEKYDNVSANSLGYIGITKKMIFRYGYYADGILDYDIVLDESYKLSDYDCIDDLVDDYLSWYYDNSDIYANEGMLKMQRKNVCKALERLVHNAANECERMAIRCCNDVLVCYGRFDNGGALYREYGDIDILMQKYA